MVRKLKKRPVEDVKRERKEVQATLLQSLQDDDPLETPAEASASSSLKTPVKLVQPSARAPSEGGSVDNLQATRRMAASLGINSTTGQKDAPETKQNWTHASKTQDLGNKRWTALGGNLLCQGRA